MCSPSSYLCPLSPPIKQGDFGRSWETLNSSDASEIATTPPEYLYRSASSLDGLPYLAAHALYGGGGYVFELRGSLRSMLQRAEQLKEEGWIDRYTRAVFVEFTVYNAQVTSPFVNKYFDLDFFSLTTFITVSFTTSCSLKRYIVRHHK